MKLSFKITPARILYIAFILMLVLTCLPITMVFPGIIRKSMQGLALLLFILGLGMQRQKAILLEYIFCCLFFFTYIYNVWGFTQSLFSCLFNTMAGFSFVFYSIYLIYNKDNEENKKYIRKALRAVILVFMITSITTIIGLQRYPLAVRELGRSGSGYASTGDDFIALKAVYRKMNIAGWNMAFGIVLMCPIFVRLFQITKEKKYIVFLAISEVCVLFSQLTIGLILSVLGIFLALYRPSKKAKDIIILLFVLFIAFIMLFMLDGILLLTVRITNNLNLSFVSDKLKDALMLLSGSVGSDASARFDRYSKSLAVFFRYPVMGISIHGVPHDGMFGNHSDIFNLLGYYGGFGIVVMIIMVCRYFNHIKVSVGKNSWIYISQLFIFILLAVLNPVWYSPQVFIGAMLMPTLVEHYQKKRTAHIRIKISGLNPNWIN